MLVCVDVHNDSSGDRLVMVECDLSASKTCARRIRVPLGTVASAEKC